MGSLSCRSLEDVVTTGYIPKKVLKIIIKKSPWGKKKKKRLSDDPLGLFCSSKLCVFKEETVQ